MLADILGRRNTEMLAEGGREGGLAGVAYGIGHLSDVDLLFSEQAGGLFHTDVLYEVVDGEARHLLHLAVQMGAADASLSADKADVELAVRDVFVDALHNALQKKLVVALHLDIFDVFIYTSGVAVDNLNG